MRSCRVETIKRIVNLGVLQWSSRKLYSSVFPTTRVSSQIPRRVKIKGEILNERVNIGKRYLNMTCLGQGNPTVVFEVGFEGTSSYFT